MFDWNVASAFPNHIQSQMPSPETEVLLKHLEKQWTVGKGSILPAGRVSSVSAATQCLKSIRAGFWVGTRRFIKYIYISIF